MSYKKKYAIGEFNRRVTIKSWTSTQDSGGGASRVEFSSFQVWAKVEDRSGSSSFQNAQETWSYDAKFIIRTGTEIKSDYTIDYGGARYKIESLSVDSEGTKRFYVIQASKTDERV